MGWKMTDGRWTVDRPEVQEDPIQISSLPSEVARIQRAGNRRIDVGCPGCNAIKENKRAQAHSDRCIVRIEGYLRIIHQGTERLGRRSEVINEAWLRRYSEKNRGKRRDEDAPATMPEPEPAECNLRESPVEPDPNAKRDDL